MAGESPAGGVEEKVKRLGCNLQLAKLETVKLGNVPEVEEASIFGRKRGLLGFVGDRNQGVATIGMVGGCTRVHAGDMGERYATYKGITGEGGGRRFEVHENISIRLSGTFGNEAQFVEVICQGINVSRSG